MDNSLWVQQRFNAFYQIPADNQIVPKSDPAVYGWPIKSADHGSCWRHVPYIINACFSHYSARQSSTHDVNDINLAGAKPAYHPCRPMSRCKIQ